MSAAAMLVDASEHPGPAPSAARVEANRLNALRSTGPRTDEGKRRARLNATKHGLTARLATFEEEDARREGRRASLEAIYQPSGDWGGWACDQAAYLSTQIDRAASMLRSTVEVAATLADDPVAWAEARKAEVARVAAKMGRDPGRAVASLMGCPHGIDWMVAQWHLLRLSAEKGDGWDDRQSRLALDLLRLPRDQRIIAPVGAFILLHPAEPPPASLGEVCRRMIDKLTVYRETAAEADELERVATLAEASDRLVPEARRFRRYEGSLRRELRCVVDGLEAAKREAAGARNEPNAADAPGVDARNEPNPAAVAANPAAGAQNEANPSPPANETKPNPPTSQPADGPPRPASPAQVRRPDPARLLRKDRKRRRRA